MKQAFAALTAVLVGVSFAGCARVQTKVVEKPRVDQELQGNRGYLKGSAPAQGDRRQTREMVETNVELPTLAEVLPWRKRKAAQEAQQQAALPHVPAPAPAYEPPSREWEPQEPEIEPIYEEPRREEYDAPAGGGTQYTVQKNDTLQKISQKHFGTTKHWYKIYQANKAVLKSPDRIKPGQVITIPDLASAGGSRGGNEYK